MRQGKKNKSNYKIALKLNSAQLMNQYMSPVENIIPWKCLQVSSYMDYIHPDIFDTLSPFLFFIKFFFFFKPGSWIF